MELKPTQNSCKLQLYNLPLWLFCDKTPKTDSRLKREFGNSGKTHLHLIQNTCTQTKLSLSL